MTPAPGHEIPSELCEPMFCGLTQPYKCPILPVPCKYNTWKDMVESTYEELKQSPQLTNMDPSTSIRVKTEAFLLSQAQRESFPDEFKDLKAGKKIVLPPPPPPPPNLIVF